MKSDKQFMEFAIELAKKGWTTKQILSYYYPKTKYGFLP